MDRELTEQVRELLLARYGIDAVLTRLGSERDETYRASPAPGTGSGDVIVKVCAAEESREVVELQLAVVDHLARCSSVPVPATVPTADGASITCWRPPGEAASRMVHVMSCLPGVTVAEQELEVDQAARVGAVHGELTVALGRLRLPAAHRTLVWDLAGLGQLADAIAAPSSQARLAARVVDCFTRSVRPVAEAPGGQVVHGDYSVHNVLADPAAAGFVTGVIDFGDVHVGPVVYDLAIAVANLIDHRLADPWSLAHAHVRGFLGAHDVPPAQLRVLVAAAAARCVQRALLAQWRARTDPSRAEYARSHARHDWVHAEIAFETIDAATDHLLSAASSHAPSS